MSGIKIRIPDGVARKAVIAGIAASALIGNNVMSGIYTKGFADETCRYTHQSGKPAYDRDVILAHQGVRQRNFLAYEPSFSPNPDLPIYIAVPAEILSFPLEMAAALIYPVHSLAGREIGIRAHNNEAHLPVTKAESGKRKAQGRSTG